MRRLLLSALVAILPAGLFAARLTLRDGSVVYGRFISGSSQEIVFQDDQGVRRRFDTNRVRNVEFEQGNVPAGAYQNNQYDRNNNDQYNRSSANPYERGATSYNRSNNNNADRSADSRYGNALAVLPIGTQISVRTNESINAQTTVEGRTYSANIDSDVVDGSGRVVIPRGSEAALVIRSIDEGGKLTGGNLVLDLQSVRVNGRGYLISTTDVVQRNPEGIGKNRRTGELVGGGAALGTIIGAVAGGGKGALLGALAGAGGGGAVQVLTKGNEIRVPAETQLTFRLDQPLQLSETQ